MAEIYRSQIQWKSPEAREFQARKIDDYISGPMAQLGQVANAASGAMAKIKDQDAANKMKLAGQEAQFYIDNFEDFSGENYMGKMESEAMAIWDNAFNSLDDDTRARFEMYNPKAREIFNLKVGEAATNKTFEHVYTQWDRRVPMIASQITSLDDPESIKFSLEAEVDKILNESGMRAADAEKVIDKLRKEVSQGAISQMIGEQRYEEATALNNDLEFSALLGPVDRAKNNMAIQKALEAKKEKEEKEPSLTEKQKANRESVYNDARSGLSNFYDLAKANGAEKNWSDTYFQFLNDFQEGKLADTYVVYDDEGKEIASFPAAAILGDDSYALLTDMEYADRLQVAEDLLKVFQDSPAVRKKMGEMLVDGQTILDSLPLDDRGRIDIPNVDDAALSRIKNIIDKSDENYARMNKDYNDMYNRLRYVYIAKQNIMRSSLAPTNNQSTDDVMTLDAALGRTDVYANAQSQFTYKEMFDAQNGVAPLTMGGAQKDTVGKNRIEDRLNPFWANNNGGKIPPAGSNHMMIDITMATLQDVDDQTKEALGIKDVSPEQIVSARNSTAYDFIKNGLYNSEVDGKKALRLPRPTVSYSSGVKWDDLAPAERVRLFSAYMQSLRGTGTNPRTQEYNPRYMSVEELKEKAPWVLYGTKYFTPESEDHGPLTKYDKRALLNSTNSTDYDKYFKSKTAAELEREIVANIEKGLRSDKDAFGEFKSAVDVVKAGLERDKMTNTFGFDTSLPIEQSSYYGTIVHMIRKINNQAQPDANVVRNLASEIREKNFETWMESVLDGVGISRSAHNFDEDSQERAVTDMQKGLTIRNPGI